MAKKKAAKTKKVKKTTKKTTKKTATKKTTAKAAKTEAEPATKAVKKKTKRKSRSKRDGVDVPMRLFWGVFNHAMKPVAKYAFNQRKAAEKKAKELSPEGKPPHFVAKMKEPVEET